MTTPSGEPYQYGDDTVAARLEVDIPADAIQNLGDLNRLTADIRANMEATAKYNQDYVQYLRELPSAIGEVGAAQSQMSASQSSIFGGGNGEAIPRDPFAGRSYGDGSGSMTGQSGSGRPMRGVDESTLIGLARDNPRQVANMAADRGLDDYFDDDQSRVLPRQAPGPGPRPGSGREMQFSGRSRPPSTPSSPRASTGPGDDNGRAAGTGTGRQVTPEGTESQAERAAKRLLAELDKGADTRDIGQRARGIGDNIQQSSLLNFLNTEGGTRGRQDALGFAGGIGGILQNSSENVQRRVSQEDEQKESLLRQAGEVAATNPELAAQLTSRAQGIAGSSGMMGRAMPLLKGVGVAGAGVAAIAGVNAAVQKTGETIHDIQGEGVQMGGGLAEGMAFESQVRTMAMNPFISTEQSRKIMQSALQTGYTGKEFDTMTEFMADNLKSMNLEVAESTKLLQQNVLKGGQDMTSLQAQLSQNVAMAGVTNMSTDQINDQFGRISGGLIDAGSGGAEAGATAQSLSGLFANNDVLKDTGGDLLNKLLTSNTTVQSHFAAGSGMAGQGIPLSATGAWATDNLTSGEITKQTVDAIGETLRPAVAMYSSGNIYPARKMAASLLGVNENQAQEILELYVSGEIFNMVSENEQRLEDTGGGRMTETGGGFFSRANPKMLGEVVSGIGHLGKRGWNAAFGNDESKENAKAGYDRWENEFALDMQLKGAAELYGGKAYAPDVLRQLAVDEHDGDFSKITIVEDGKEKQLSSEDVTNEEKMNKLLKGDIQVKTEGGGVQTLREWGNSANTSEAGTGGMSHVVELGPEASQFFKLNSPNTAQQNADRGVGNRNSHEAAPYGIPTGPGK